MHEGGREEGEKVGERERKEAGRRWRKREKKWQGGRTDTGKEEETGEKRKRRGRGKNRNRLGKGRKRREVGNEQWKVGRKKKMLRTLGERKQ